MTLFLLLAACTPDQEFNPAATDKGDVELEPDIEIEPDSLDFGSAERDAVLTASITIENRGDVELQLQNLVMSGTSAFTVGTADATAVIAPGAKITVPISFTPANPEDYGTLLVTSNDPDSPALNVPITGSGLIPQLFISPNPYAFGDVMLNCEQEQPLTFTNIGNADLLVDQVVVTAAGFDVGELPLPFALAPGESQQVPLSFVPTEEVSYGGEVWATSNALVNTSIVTVSGSGTSDPDVTDEFWQGDGPWDRTDIFFYVDQSGSMVDDKENMTANFASFVSMLEGLDLDWQIIISTFDSGCSNTGILTPDTPNLEAAFLEGVTGYAGSYTEAGLAIAAAAMGKTSAGKCNEGFLREDSKTTLVLVSDEPDQSPGTWASYVSSIQSYSPNAAITAIVGDYPGGCSTADEGAGYYEAAIATKGAFLSICEPDWTAYFKAIATLSSTGQTDRFGLSSKPDPASIVVTVDSSVVSTGWSYDEGGQAVVFEADAVPDPGAHIVIDYRIAGDCAE